MVCYHPLEAYFPLNFDFEGKRKLIFSKTKIYEFKKRTIRKLENVGLLPRYNDSNFEIFSETNRFPEAYIDSDIKDNPDGLFIPIPCGKCIGCKQDYARRWAVRACNEASLHNDYQNCAFLTLTFNDENLRNTTLGNSVDKAWFRSWIKNLRFRVKSEYGVEFRHLSCGEYGSKRSRTHYHMLIFGFNFPDKYAFKQQYIKGKLYTYYRSPFLESCWHLPYQDKPAGFCVVGSVSYESCAYVSRYVLKKVLDSSPYGDRQPEFLLFSRMPGLGHDYIVQNYKNIFDTGKIALPNGFTSPIPRYYESVVEKIAPEVYYNYKFDSLMRLRKEMLSKFRDSKNDSQSRLNDREAYQFIQNDKLIRSYELDTSFYIIYTIFIFSFVLYAFKDFVQI